MLVELSDRFFFDVVQDDWLPGARLILISVIGGLLVGPITHFLAAAGAAGGVAGIFNAPIAGVFFALEVLLRRFGTRNFSVIVLSSVVATVTAIRLTLARSAPLRSMLPSGTADRVSSRRRGSWLLSCTSGEGVGYDDRRAE